MERHTDTSYERELLGLREQVLLMGATVEELLTGAVQAFKKRDLDRAKRLVELDSQIDQLELEIDDMCLSILARRQPVASDLRFVTAVLKVVTDLERIGDLSTNICRRTQEGGRAEHSLFLTELGHMADISASMLADALDAFVAGNTSKAGDVRLRDKQVDEIYANLFPPLIRHMTEHPDDCDRGMRVLSVAKDLERIGDHATNLAEMVVFMVQGQDVRHGGKAAVGM